MDSAADTDAMIAALQAGIDAQIDRSRALADETERLGDEVARATVSITSPDRRVTVTAQPSGAITDIALAVTSVELSPADLSRVLTATVAAAQRAAADHALQLMESTLGHDSALVAAVRRDVDAAYPADGQAR